MDIATRYEPAEAEARWYAYWLGNGFFRSTPDDREPYTIIIPPPNVTGVLHMGHMLNNTIQDVLIRRARMRGYNACWVPGTDHASIATEAKVVEKLRNQGVEKKSLTREQFLEHAWEWTHKHGGIILEQLKRLGASCDWARTLFTMDDERYISVIKVFIDLYEKGLIYRGVRMINWDPRALTAVSDEEVVYTEEKSKLYHVRYRIVGEDGWVTIATTRPETILGDMAVCANPADERYRHMKGKRIIVPMSGREVPFIFDDYVDMEFGTGCLKITPAHDINDYEIGLRHNLESVDIFNDDGTLSEAAGLFIGRDRFEARALAEEELRRIGALEKVEDYINKIGRSERTNAVIEPKLSLQWFLRMKEISEPALGAVMNGTVRLFPGKFRNVYRHWMENVRDWCISRQLWWGHRIPAWYYGNGSFVVAVDSGEALEKARRVSGNPRLTMDDLRQDEDVLDTWFSSWLWPLTCFDGINHPDNNDINYYYPSKVLVTAPEILFFWVARMIIAGYEYRGREPFADVYLTGLVRDDQRRKMSKSLGNSPDPVELMDRYGADGVRVGMLLCSPAGNDLLYNDSLPEQGRNFANKIWNAFRLIRSWSRDDSLGQPEWSASAVKWMDSVLNAALPEIDGYFEKYRISDALMACYRLFWDSFSSWYLEIVKPVSGRKIDTATYDFTISVFDKLLRVLHPFMPFITEEIWQRSAVRKKGESIMTAAMPVGEKSDHKVTARFKTTTDIISAVRAVRKENKISNRDQIELYVNTGREEFSVFFPEVIKRMCNIPVIHHLSPKPAGAASFMAGTLEFFIPLSAGIDLSGERTRLEKEINYYRGFLSSVEAKLNNAGFRANAPAQVIETEMKKKTDAELKLSALISQLDCLPDV